MLLCFFLVIVLTCVVVTLGWLDFSHLANMLDQVLHMNVEIHIASCNVYLSKRGTVYAATQLLLFPHWDGEIALAWFILGDHHQPRPRHASVVSETVRTALF